MTYQNTLFCKSKDLKWVLNAIFHQQWHVCLVSVFVSQIKHYGDRNFTCMRVLSFNSRIEIYGDIQVIVAFTLAVL